MGPKSLGSILIAHNSVARLYRDVPRVPLSDDGGGRLLCQPIFRHWLSTPLLQFETDQAIEGG